MPDDDASRPAFADPTRTGLLTAATAAAVGVLAVVLSRLARRRGGPTAR